MFEPLTNNNKKTSSHFRKTCYATKEVRKYSKVLLNSVHMKFINTVKN